MKLTNKDKQKELDYIKWNLSEIENKDLSGTMDYCGYCPYQLNGLSCKAEQSKREEQTLCAKAFNKKNAKK